MGDASTSKNRQFIEWTVIASHSISDWSFGRNDRGSLFKRDLFTKNPRQKPAALSTFLFFAIVGAYSAAHDGDFVRLILGDNYVNMTLENIEKGDPMAVYKKMGEGNMFIQITLNNLKVAMMAFVFGMLFSVGTLYVMMQNGIMLGSFLYFFYQKDLLWESSRTIWIHGTIEISVIIIAGCAGLVLGNGLLFEVAIYRK